MREEFLRKSEFQHLRKKCSHNQSMYLQKILEYAAKNISQQSQVPSHPYLGISKKNFWLEFIADEKLQNTTHFYPGDTISKNTNYIVCVHFSHSLAGNIII